MNIRCIARRSQIEIERSGVVGAWVVNLQVFSVQIILVRRGSTAGLGDSDFLSRVVSSSRTAGFHAFHFLYYVEARLN